jgi:hypothetical protein
MSPTSQNAAPTPILTIKGNQPHLHAQLAALPWRAVPDATRDTDRGHGRREIRTLRILTIASGIDFPHAAQAIQIRRRRRRLDQPKRFTTETVYAITDLRVHQAKPAQLAAWIRGHWHIENKIHWVRDVTYDEDRSQIRTGTRPEVMATLRNAATGALRTVGITNIAAGTRHHARDSTRPLALLASFDDFAGALGSCVPYRGCVAAAGVGSPFPRPQRYATSQGRSTRIELPASGRPALIRSATTQSPYKI